MQTDMGQRLADAVGFLEPPLAVEDSAKCVLERVSLVKAD